MANYNVKQMEATIKHLSAQLKLANSEIASQKEYISKASKDTEDILKKCRKFCMKILEQEITNGNFEEKELDSLALSDLIRVCEAVYNKDKKDTIKVYDTFVNKFEEKKSENDSLRIQISQLQIRLAQIAAGDGTMASAVDEEKLDLDSQRVPAYAIEDGKDTNDNIKPAFNDRNTSYDTQQVDDFAANVVRQTSKDIQTVNGNRKPTSSPIVMNYDKLRQSINPVMWKIIEVMGSQGLCEYPEIKTACMKELSGKNAVGVSAINQGISNLKKMQIITDGLKIHTGIRWFYVYELTDELGRRFYIEKFNKQPVLNEVRQLIKEHDNEKHGYYIKEASIILKNKFKYESVCTNRKANTQKLPNGRLSIPDIICSNSNGITDYFEVECGNHTQGDFNDKCNKLSMITKEIRFIVPNNDVMTSRLIPQIQGWIQKRGLKTLRNAKVTVYLTTMTKLFQQEWAAVFDMSSNMPVLNQ